MTHRMRSLINILCFLTVLTINYLANELPLNGVTQKELSASYSIHITPAGYVFAIWGLIYLGLLAYIVIQAMPKWVSREELRRLDLPFAISCACNALWLVVWHYQYLSLSVIFMLGLLISLIVTHIYAQKLRKNTKDTVMWLIQKTFGLYVGWVGLATILNISIWLDSLGWKGEPLSGAIWGAIMLLVATVIYLYVGLAKRDVAPLGVLAWASLGIAVKNQSHIVIWNVGLGVSALCLVSLLGIIFRNKRAKIAS
ncbi:MAG: hypothetical protein CL916_13545 [Deltaproteobacteria bacterium]|nr:hypothetical protein [Deltaproteobacteria bacterium]